MIRINRRDFARVSALGVAFTSSSAKSTPGPAVIEPFDYDGVRLKPSRLLTQYEAAREFYLGLSDDDILHGFRKKLGSPRPANHLAAGVGRLPQRRSDSG